MIKKPLFYILALTLLSCSSVPEKYTRLDSGETLGLEEMLGQIENDRVIFVGEIHSDEESQALQFKVIEHLFEKGKDLTIAIEIFPESRQDALDKWIDGEGEIDDFEKEFMEIVHLPFGSYEEIFEFAKENGIRIVGIDADTQFINDAAKKGIQTVPRRLLRMYKFSDCSGNPGYSELLGFDSAIGYHERGFPFLCDGQRLRDAVMAYNIAKLLKETRTTVVVLAGIAHAAKAAVPRMLQEHVHVPHKVIVTGRIKNLIKGMPDKDVADYVY